MQSRSTGWGGAAAQLWERGDALLPVRHPPGTRGWVTRGLCDAASGSKWDRRWGVPRTPG